MDVSIGANLAAVRAALADAARVAGRDPDDVTLVAVSKRHGPDAIRAAYAAGQRDFGENYAQELRDKAAALADLPELRWHYIGRIQSNKAAWIAPVSVLVHAIDSLEHARALARRAEAPVPCLVAVNVAGEQTKGGVPADRALDLCRVLAEEPGVALRGLMTMPPYEDDPERSAPHFRALRRLAEAGRAEGLPLHALSMGMTSDFAVAVREGATLVRIGTAIFGPRD